MKLRKTCINLSALILLLMMNTVQLKAQGLPCGDPDVDCPIDGPVILLVAVVLLLSIKKIAGARLVSIKQL
jgi:hypothetical protein